MSSCYTWRMSLLTLCRGHILCRTPIHVIVLHLAHASAYTLSYTPIVNDTVSLLASKRLQQYSYHHTTTWQQTPDLSMQQRLLWSYDMYIHDADDRIHDVLHQHWWCIARYSYRSHAYELPYAASNVATDRLCC
jgi:hypothetical protein